MGVGVHTIERLPATADPGVPPGYKYTEAGVLPADWAVTDVGSLHPFVTSGSRGWARYYADAGRPFIRIGNVSRASIYLDLTDLKFVQLPEPGDAEAARTSVQDGDLLVSITADIGIVAYVDESVDKPAYINQHLAIVRVGQQSVCNKFIAYYLASERPQRLFVASKDVGAKAGMNLTTVRKIRLVLPHPGEQEAIAGALSDVDDLIGTLEALIAKKRAIKQAAVQQLLTAKTRLPGFTADWKRIPLRAVADVLKGAGLSRSQVHPAGQRPCILYGELFTTYGRVARNVVSRTDSCEGVPSVVDDVLLPGSTTTSGVDLATATALPHAGVALGGDVNIIRRRDNVYDSAYLANYLTYVKRREIAEISQGITIHHLYGRDLRNLTIELPSVDEQIAVATVLSDMDAEIAGLEQRLNKTRAIKQGMMQQLLTGRVRLAKVERDVEQEQSGNL